MLEFAVFSKNLNKNLLPTDLQLTSVSQTTRINNLTKFKRLLNTITTDNNTKNNEIIPKPIRQEKGKRPRGRPRKQIDTSSVLLHNSSNLLDKFRNFETYLQYAKFKQLQTNTGVFMGNLYELQVKSFLEKQFKIQSTLHQGGSNDKGIDINAIWNPMNILKTEKTNKDGISNNIDDNDNDNKKYEIVNMKKIKPLAKRSNQTIKLFVQCKCYKLSKIDPKLIREIKGSSQEYFKKNGNSAIFMIASTNGFTRVGREDFDKATIPLMYAKFTKPKLINKRYPFEIDSWEIGKLDGVYLNPLATAMFKGLDWISFMNKLKSLK